MELCATPLCYELLAEVGEGSYGKVYKAREVGQKRRLLAVKKFNIRGDSSENGIPAFMIREVALLRKMKYFNHPNIVELLEASAVPVGRNLDLTLVLEYIDQDLSTYLAKVPACGLTRDCIKDVMQQLLRGLDFLHTNMVLHRDLKPENVLVSSRGEVKIADFGLARIYTFNIALTPGVVTLWYRAPEVLLNSVYMSTVDIWSAGCIFAELFHLSVIGFPSEEDWPEDSPIPYCVNWGPNGSCAKLLHNLGPEENDLLSVSSSVFRFSSHLTPGVTEKMADFVKFQTALAMNECVFNISILNTRATEVNL
ncbi:cyclin-dependent kinase 6 isoform 4-T4 [Spinachia spinachia]